MKQNRKYLKDKTLVSSYVRELREFFCVALYMVLRASHNVLKFISLKKWVAQLTYYVVVATKLSSLQINYINLTLHVKNL